MIKQHYISVIAGSERNDSNYGGAWGAMDGSTPCYRLAILHRPVSDETTDTQRLSRNSTSACKPNQTVLSLASLVKGYIYKHPRETSSMFRFHLRSKRKIAGVHKTNCLSVSLVH